MKESQGDKADSGVRLIIKEMSKSHDKAGFLIPGRKDARISKLVQDRTQLRAQAESLDCRIECGSRVLFD
jgi:hypothetical protein